MSQTDCLQHTHWETWFRWISHTNTNQSHWVHTHFSEARTLSREVEVHAQGLRASHLGRAESIHFSLLNYNQASWYRYQQSTRHSSWTCKAMWNSYFWKIQYLKQTRLNNVDSHLPFHFASLQSSCLQPWGVRLTFCPRSTASSGMTISLTHSHLLWGLGFSHHPLSYFLKTFKIFYFWLHWVSVATQGLSLVTEWGLLSSCRARASHCGGFSHCGAQALGCAGFRSCDAQAWLPPGMWDFQGLGIKPGSPVLAGGFLITGPPGKAPFHIFNLAFNWPFQPSKSGEGLLPSFPLVTRVPLYLFRSLRVVYPTPFSHLLLILEAAATYHPRVPLAWDGWLLGTHLGHLSLTLFCLVLLTIPLLEAPLPWAYCCSCFPVLLEVCLQMWSHLSFALHAGRHIPYSSFWLLQRHTHLSSNCLVSPFDPRPAPEFSGNHCYLPNNLN